jgi:citrate synthase
VRRPLGPPLRCRAAAEDRSRAVTDDTAILSFDGSETKLGVVRGTEDELGIDITKLRADTGLITLDDGFLNTGSCTSAITYIDGEQGILRYRGIPIEELVSGHQPSFLETSFLLIHGDLPNREQLDEFRYAIRKHTLVHEDVKRFFDGFPKDAHPMATLSSAITALSTFYQDSLDPKDPEEAELSIIRLMAKLPTIAAYAYKKSVGQPFVYPNNKLDLIENFLTMMFSLPTEPYEVSPTVVKALKVLLILHADHEQNCSTSTVRLVGSSEVNIYAAIAAGINALWGPLHGGANQAVIEMLEAIRDGGGNVDTYVAKAKDPNDHFRLSGFGHRVYKNYDPRARILKEIAGEVIDEMGGRDELLDLAKQLEAAALADEYFIERKLYPNVDFYSGLIYRAMGFPTNMFTVLFAMGRLPGWLAHWKEMIESPKTKIGRPRQIYVGETERHYVPVADRA